MPLCSGAERQKKSEKNNNKWEFQYSYSHLLEKSGAKRVESVKHVLVDTVPILLQHSKRIVEDRTSIMRNTELLSLFERRGLEM